jgi:hypothetical protein
MKYYSVDSSSLQQSLDSALALGLEQLDLSSRPDVAKVHCYLDYCWHRLASTVAPRVCGWLHELPRTLTYVKIFLWEKCHLKNVSKRNGAGEYLANGQRQEGGHMPSYMSTKMHFFQDRILWAWLLRRCTICNLSQRHTYKMSPRQNVSSTKRLLDKTSPRQNVSQQNVSQQNVSLTKRLCNKTFPCNKTSPI